MMMTDASCGSSEKAQHEMKKSFCHFYLIQLIGIMHETQYDCL